ncbi:hypothetical protein EUGRSUZ_I02065 [Eucalyptus grandis]|uniref:Uncharacterized protein n=2 Tax=Eucalyptus grandis TaxID=71139 RepID=A0ACC3JHG7_EUCGR|nr:hypothetical protein EUGRSUZ_I02065 [Eucalyptus grandis]
MKESMAVTMEGPGKGIDGDLGVHPGGDGLRGGSGGLGGNARTEKGKKDGIRNPGIGGKVTKGGKLSSWVAPEPQCSPRASRSNVIRDIKSIVIGT